MLSSMSAEPLQIGAVAKKSGISIDAIRFYEKVGLLPSPSRTKGGHRLYSQRELEDLQFIQQAQQLGFSLAEIQELFSIQRHPQAACEHVRDLVAHKLAVVRTKINDLQRLENVLTDALSQCRKALRESPKHPDCCPVLQEIATAPSRRKKA